MTSATAPTRAAPRSPDLSGRVRALVKHQLATGDLAAGGRLPSERWLTEHLGVSRMTTRHALFSLEAQGLIYRLDRLGWYCAPPRFVYDPTANVSFAEAVRAQGRQPGSMILSAQRTEADAWLVGEHRIPAGTPVYAIRRLRLIDDRPVFVEASQVMAERFPGLMDLVDSDVSLARLYRQSYCVHIGRREVHMHPTAILNPQAGELRVSSGTPGLHLVRVSSDAQGEVITIDREIWRHDALEIRVVARDEPGRRLDRHTGCRAE